MLGWSDLRTLVPEHWRESLRDTQVRFSLTLVDGPRRTHVGPEEAVVTCVVKNGSFYVDQFVAHYLSRGFRHIYFLDNGSTDDTVERALRHREVTVYRCTLPVSAHQRRLKKRLAEVASPAGWCLDADIDEFFDYPHSDVLPLRHFLAYLNGRGYSAVLTQMLDMFSDQPLSSLVQARQERLAEVYRHYDISQVKSVPYWDDSLAVTHGSANAVSHPSTALYWGGIRTTMYGIKCCLTKHSLFRTGAGAILFPHVHFVNQAQLADVSAVLLHYKFTSNALQEAALNTAAFTRNSSGYDRIIATITDRPDSRMVTETTTRFERAAELLDSGFLFASDRYLAYARTAARDEDGTSVGGRPADAAVACN